MTEARATGTAIPLKRHLLLRKPTYRGEDIGLRGSPCQQAQTIYAAVKLISSGHSDDEICTITGLDESFVEELSDLPQG